MPLRKTRYRREPLKEINITNLIDIIMVLLIVFILISEFNKTGLNIDLPKATFTETSGKRSIVIGLTAADTITVNGDRVTRDELPGVLNQLKMEYPDERIYIHSDGFAVVQQLVTVMSEAKKAGFVHVGIPVNPTNQ